MLAISYSSDDIRRQFSGGAFRNAEAYRNQGRVVAFERRGDLIEAAVRGSDDHPYEQTIALRRNRGMLLVSGECTCPVGFNCKHVAAALLRGLSNIPSTPPSSPPSKEVIASRRVARMLDRPYHPVEAGRGPATEMPPSVLSWLQDLETSRKTASEDYPSSIAQRIIYVLAPLPRPHGFVQLGVTAISVRLLKDGRFSQSARPYRYASSPHGNPAQFLRPSDIRILTALERMRPDYGSSSYALAREDGATILTEALSTGRARWGEPNGPPLHEGETRPGRFGWTLSADATLRPMLDVGDGVLAFHAIPPVYVDVEAGTVGSLETGHAPKVAAALLAAPPVPADRVAALNEALSKRMPDLPAARPPVPDAPLQIASAPRPHLSLLAVELPSQTAYGYHARYGYQAVLERVGVARLSFRYGSVDVPLGESRPSLTLLHEGRLVTVQRDAAAERRELGRLLTLGFVPWAELRSNLPKDHAWDLTAEGGDTAWLDVLYRDLPQLRSAGWTIEIARDFPVQLIRADAPFDAEVHEGSGIDWFEFELGVAVDGERVSLIEPIVALIGKAGFDPAVLESARQQDKPFYLPLADGRVLALSSARLAPMVTAIRDLAGGRAGGRGRLRLARADAAGLALFEDATAQTGIVWRGGDNLREMGRKLASSGGIPPAVPPVGFTATLRPYQAEGFSWLAFLRDVGLGGILADDMGLGKTVQALALIAGEKAAGRLDAPALVIAPTSLMANWRREAERFAPDLRVLTLHGLERRKNFERIADSDVVLTTYPLVARDHAVLAETPWHLLILDEAQTIKNPDATTTRRIVDIKARHRFCLTGTPLENHLGELWSLFSFALPGLLGDRQNFTRQWRTPIEKRGDSALGKRLAYRVKPFLLRRTKEEVAGELPPKTEIAERIEFEAGQRDVYEAIRLSMHKRVRDAIAAKGLAGSHIIILDALLKLRQACCDPRLLKLSAKAAAHAGSAKLARLEEMLTELLSENRRILVFSQFTSMLDLIRPQLEALDIRYALLTGRTRDRDAEIQRFQTGDAPVFLVSLKAGGVGLNLTAADTVILYDPWWNPAVEEQAIDRAHRIGQDKPIFVHKLVAVGTIEEKMELLKEKKRALAESLFDHDGTPTLAMTEADLDMLFAA